ncbi:DUF1015 domain-containing protein [Methanoregula sp.]|uniref:DUF1015 domain-containing protein n=1 Tax=Methanoregula sp. TaxID=2052170 RepID=UPI000CBF99FB|nr:DUF1015 family protein [Methanoregula sp.]PKG32777.1 MAG: DUF1015 domain-containing protein [Methanoregula sp.]
MVRIYRFSGVRPVKEAAPEIAAVPYDVVTADEAKAIIAKNQKSFLRVSRPDAELPGIPPHDERVYQRAREMFLLLEREGLMKKDPEPGMYLYQAEQDGDIFLGLCCCLDVDDYRKNRIRRHELTRYDKEEDRTRHIEAVRAHNGPVVLLYRDDAGLFSFIEAQVTRTQPPVAEVRTEQGAVHQIFRIADPGVLAELEQRFAAVPALYIADGHHRAKASVNLADKILASGNQPGEEICRFMGVVFAHNRVKIHGYSRLLTDLGSFSPDMFTKELGKYFTVRPYAGVDGSVYNIPPAIAEPERYHVVHLYLGGTWYECTRPRENGPETPDTLDVAVLQKHVLEGMLGITDPRGDARLQYLGGARPVSDLEKLVDDGTYQLAFAMQPVKVDTVLSIADAGGIMPPKSTWFEPKLLSGLVVHSFD